MGFLDKILMGEDFGELNFYGQSYNLSNTFKGLMEFAKKRKKHEMYIVCGRKNNKSFPNLVKIELEAITRDRFEEYRGLACTILEIDGVTIPQNDQINKKLTVEFDERGPNKEQQIELLLNTLGEFGIDGIPKPVTDMYVRGHLNMLRLKKQVEEE